MAFPAFFQSIDEALLRDMRDLPSSVTHVFWALTIIGGGWGLLLAVPFLARPTTRSKVLALFACELVTSGLVSAIKAIVGRVRPCDALGWCTAVLVGSPGGGSFPSGHAAGTFAFAVFVGTLRPRMLPALVPIAGAIAWSRCVLGVHYPTDVLAGALLGSACGYVAARLADRYLGEGPRAALPDAG